MNTDVGTIDLRIFRGNADSEHSSKRPSFDKAWDLSDSIALHRASGSGPDMYLQWVARFLVSNTPRLTIRSFPVEELLGYYERKSIRRRFDSARPGQSVWRTLRFFYRSKGTCSVIISKLCYTRSAADRLVTLQSLGVMPSDLTHSPALKSLALPSDLSIDPISVRSPEATIEARAIRTTAQPAGNNPSITDNRQDEVVTPGNSRCPILNDYGDGEAPSPPPRMPYRQTATSSDSFLDSDLRSTTLVTSRELSIEQLSATPDPRKQQNSTKSLKRRKSSIEEMKAELARLGREEAKVLREEREAQEGLRRRQVNSDRPLVSLCSKLFTGCHSREV